jgi:hypothetical protein
MIAEHQRSLPLRGPRWLRATNVPRAFHACVVRLRLLSVSYHGYACALGLVQWLYRSQQTPANAEDFGAFREPV